MPHAPRVACSAFPFRHPNPAYHIVSRPAVDSACGLLYLSEVNEDPPSDFVSRPKDQGPLMVSLTRGTVSRMKSNQEVGSWPHSP